MPHNTSSIYWDILEQKRRALLPLFGTFKNDFYLAGGTALALQLGHRDSIDFDFFTGVSFEPSELFQKIEQNFISHQLVKIQDEPSTLTITVDKDIKLSFFSYPYPLVSSFIETDHFFMASLEDIGPMKLSAITSRSVLKDYIDLYFILQQLDLPQLLSLTQRKLPTIDPNLILKSLVYYEDVQEEPIKFKNGHAVTFQQVKNFLSETVKQYLAN